jgi:hypothetical protein
VAQLGARLDGIEEVVGSNPIGSTNLVSGELLGEPIVPAIAPYPVGVNDEIPRNAL